MSVRSPALAKLTRPKLFDAVARPRLFALLDEAARRPIVWICAPPGSGKTTLVASYLEERGLRHVWYQVDAGDVDPATFVHYMRAAALRVARKNAVLPLFPPEPQQDLSRFARSFFRDLFEVLPRPCAIVLDNFQEARPAVDHRAALAQGLEEIPDGITVFVVSRTDPPPEFARLIASRRIGRMDEAALRCTPDEANAILGKHTLDERVVRRIVRQSDGWVAALILLREHLSHHGVALEETLGEGKEAIFQYFAGEIFNRARPENQRMLMLTAIAPSITPAEAVALTGNEDAPRLLEYLYRRHLFLDRRRGEQTTYQYHALFREYLHEEMQRRVPRDVRRSAIVRTAALLAERGQPAEALELYREAGEWEAMRAVIGAHALEWARQGRAQALSDWIEALPASLRASDPWLEYWFGRAWIFLQPKRGRPALERAFKAFLASGDLRGQALALSTIVTGYYYEWADFRPIDRWLPEFDRILAEGQSAELDRESELRTRAAQLIAVLLRRPDEEGLQRCASRLDALIDGEPDVNVRVMAASILLNTYNWTKDGDEAGALIARVEPVIAEGEVAPLMQVWWREHLSFWYLIAGRYDAADAVIVQAREIAERYGLETYLFGIDLGQAMALISKGELAAAKSLVDAMERRMAPTRRMDWAYLHYLRSMLAQHLGQCAAAVQEAERGVALSRETGPPILEMPRFLMRLAHSRSAAGDRDGCAQAMDEAIASATGVDRTNFERQRELLQIDDDIDAGRSQQAAQRLAAVMASYRERDQVVFLPHRPDMAARLADFALGNAIETEFVRTLIERNHLAPPAGASSAWPFRLRVTVLGRFELMRDGQAMRFSGKTQQRPLDVLKLVVALGGRDVDARQVMAGLWPEADGAAAKTSFDAALFRLRKLLDVEQAITLTGGKLSLSTALVWTDVRELEAAIEAAQRVGEAPGVGLSAAAARLIDAYPGALLGDDEAPWIAKPRDSLRARFTRALVRLGECLERRGDWPDAIDLYHRGLEADNLTESFYRGLMRSLAAHGEQAEALNAYRRCRELLSIVLGVKPGVETERLHRQIASSGTSHSLS
jgi:ATP/maltotriose-dependent transcriptional regulator MalT/DNA-binding SARP family transcriptional activator